MKNQNHLQNNKNQQVKPNNNKYLLLLIFLIFALYLRVKGLSLNAGVFFNLGTILLVYLIGSLFNVLSGILACGFLVVSFLHVKVSQNYILFNVLTFFALLSTYFALLAFLKKNKKMLFLSVFFSCFIACAGFISLDLIKKYIQSYYLYHSSSYLLSLFNFLPVGVGPVVWVSAIAIFKYKNEYEVNLLKILFSTPIFYFGLLGLFHATEAGYSTLPVPYFCLASALVFSVLFNPKSFLFLVLIIFAFYIPFKYSVRYNKVMSLSDTRALATEWLQKNISSDYKIAWDKNSIQYNVSDSPVLEQRYLVKEKLLLKKDWFKILGKKIDYAVINSYDLEFNLRQKRNEVQKKYYKKLLKLKPEIVFNPYLLEKEKEIRKYPLEELISPFTTLWQRERGGPIVWVYKL